VKFDLDIDWARMDLREAVVYYARLKKEFELAGRTLNQRTTVMDEEKWQCFMNGRPGGCKKGVYYTRRPAGVDADYRDPITGLNFPARICSERCWSLYQQLRIEERRKREFNGH
jgi:hypothetical protein